ncbi:inactive glucose-1-phosphate adenylyltransferase small subunit 2, chloroplastic-like [Aristolochia californica]|uniref:inactive glucose-1-phosphate adenylyltransferase small subunit 2, chloroplastic-like n=1 Tax=Aristolochia californica TaxID=171875 RepID=UPI0035DF7DEB
MSICSKSRMNHREATRAKECNSVPVKRVAMETQATYSPPSLPLHTLCLSPTSPLSGIKFPILGSSYARRKSTSKHICSSPTRLTISNSCESDSFSTSVAAIVFGDGSESGLYPLTIKRSEGAIPMAGNYRLIDIVVSNCINSNINKIYALTQYNSTSLNSHLSRAYSNTGWGREGFLEVIAAYKSLEEQEWFKGTADAIRRSLWVLEQHPVMEFLVLQGHHLYKMDYQDLVLAHRNSSADITIAFSHTRENEDPGFGFLKVSSRNEVLDYKEKPEWVSQNPLKSESKRKWTEDSGYMGSMGIYVIKRDVMMKLLTELFPKAKDFGNDVISGAISMGLKVEAYLHEGYWNYFSNIEAYYHANIDCTKKKPSQFDFFDRDAPVYTLPRYLPPSSITNAIISDSVIGDGCILNNCKIRGSVIGMRTLVGNGAEIEDSVIMGSDIYQTDDQDVNGKHGEEIPIGIGEQSQIRKAIIDKHARIGKNVRIVNIDNVQEGDRQGSGYVIRGGIVIILGSALIPDGTIL